MNFTDLKFLFREVGQGVKNIVVKEFSSFGIRTVVYLRL
jgi:hypothetical protein